MSQSSDTIRQSLDNSAYDVADLLAFFWQKKFRIIFMAAVITIAGVYHIFSLPKIYSASAVVMLSQEGQSFRLGQAFSGFGGIEDTQFDTYVEFIRSRQFLGDIVKRLQLTEKREFRPQTLTSDQAYIKEHALRVLSNNLSLSRVGDTYLLRITYDSQVPETASLIANDIGPSFFAYHKEITRQRAVDTSQWLNQQLGELQDELANAESKLQSFLEDNQLIDVDSQISLARAEIAALVNEKLAIEKVLSEIRSTIVQIEIADERVDRLMQIPWMLKNPLVIDNRNKLTAQRQVMDEIQKRYLQKHPKFIAAQSRLSLLEQEQQRLLQELTASLSQEKSTLESRSDALTEQINEKKSEYSDLGKIEVQLARLQREVQSTQNLYDTFLARLQETEMFKDFGNSNEFAVVDYATTPTGPSKPRVALLSALVLMFASLFSAGFWLFLHLMSDRETRYRQLMQQIDVPITVEIPKVAGSKKSKSALLLNTGQKSYPFAEAIRSLRTSMMINTDGKERRIIAVTGINTHAGATTVAANLALSFSRLEKTLLLDLDWRNPSVAALFNIPESHSGLTEFISRRAPFSDCIFHADASPLSIMPSGEAPGDPIVYFSKPRFASILSKLGVVYDRLIIVTPPVNTYSDVIMLSKYVDSVAVVCEPDTTESTDLLNGLQRLQDAGAPIAGMVFNKMKSVRTRYPTPSKFSNLLGILRRR
ncbi:GumC family protein [Aestuariibacter salexigens]|uniref:GumC family protein n=1 Tax=Aestuariibacter salexigens TaxID=226010 RepID=UPI0004253F65|nr:polysaccharide biosynthesis tyrosine autokinase [Aestuariibacter salexigens]